MSKTGGHNTKSTVRIRASVWGYLREAVATPPGWRRRSRWKPSRCPRRGRGSRCAAKGGLRSCPPGIPHPVVLCWTSCSATNACGLIDRFNQRYSAMWFVRGFMNWWLEMMYRTGAKRIMMGTRQYSAGSLLKTLVELGDLLNKSQA